MPVDVGTLISNAENRSASMAASADLLLARAAETIAMLGDPSLLDGVRNVPALKLPNWRDLALSPQPELGVIDRPDYPDRPTRVATRELDATINAGAAPTDPSFTVPAVVDPIRPSQLRSFSATAPEINTDFSSRLPAPPSAFNGQVPSVLSSINLPTAPHVSLPHFAGVMPVAPDVSADDLSGLYEQKYRDASAMMTSALEDRMGSWLSRFNPLFGLQMSRLEERLHELSSGLTETGFSHAVEDAIYERARAKVRAESSRAQSEAASLVAGRGFTLPNGAMYAAMLAARNGGNDQLAAASREIVAMQAEMNQKNIQFALSQSQALRTSILQLALSYHGNLIQINGQALSFAQAFIDSLVKIHDLAVKIFSAKLDGYRAEAQVFEALVRASVVAVDVYKAQIEGEKAKVDVDLAKVQVFKALVDAHQAQVDVYGKSVQAVVTAAQLEKLKIESFEAQLRGYSAEVQAKEAEWRAYGAAWSGEEAKVKVLMASVQTYQAQIDAFKVRLQAESARIDAQARAKEAELRAYTADIQAYSEEVRAETQLVTAEVAIQDSQLKAHQLQSQAAIEQARANAEHYKAKANVEIEHKRMLVHSAIEAARLAIKAIEGQASVQNALGNSYASMAGASLSGMNTLVTQESQ